MGPSSPPTVLRGAEYQSNLVGVTPSVGVDWVRFVLPACVVERVRPLLVEWFGDAGTSAPGRFNLQSSTRWGTGSLHEGGHDYIVVDLPATALDLLVGRVDLRSVLGRLHGLGGRCTRLDVAADLRYNDLGRGRYVASFLDYAVDSCRAGHLCMARRYRVVEDMGLYGAEGRGLYLGARGRDGSGRFVRFYDKGLETKTAEARRWERWELEATDDVAQEIVSLLLETPDADVPRVLASAAFSAVDFRLPSETTNRNLDRRPRCDWFAVMSSMTDRFDLRVKRQASTFRSYRKWLAKTVVPGLLAVASLLGTDLRGVADYVASNEGSISLSTSWLSSQAGREACAELNPDAWRFASPEASEAAWDWIEKTWGVVRV